MRRRRTRSTTSSDKQISILLTNLNSSNQGRSRRRTRLTSSPDQQMSILPTPEPQDQYTPKALSEPTEANKEAPNTQLENENPSLTNNIDHIINQIRSELYEELRSPLVESEYWDETHSWNTNYETESDDYWHFVGRFE